MGVTRAPPASHRSDSDTTLLQQGTKIVWNRHGFRGADVGTTGVSDWYPYAREQRCRDHSQALAGDLVPIAYRSAEAQHEPMHVNVFQRVTLTEDVGAFEMMKRDFDVSLGRLGFRGVQLGLVRVSECWVHGAA